MTYLNNPKQQGFSLIEAMIAVVIGMALLGGAINIFISNNNVYRLETQLSRMQETGRFLIDTITNEIRMAGFIGCGHRKVIEPNRLTNAVPPFSIEDANSIRGFEYDGTTWTPSLPSFITTTTGIDATVLPKNDVIAIQRADACSVTLASDLATADGVITVIDNRCEFEENQAVIITDCSETADVFTISTVSSVIGSDNLALEHTTTSNSSDELSKPYRSNDGSQVLRHLSNIFYIAASEDDHTESSAWLASWDPSADTNNFRKYELADGVEQMQILYGVDDDNDEYVDEYVKADAVTDWLKVSSARINLLLHSDDNITSESRAFPFDGVINVNTANDKRLRIVFSTTVTLRNRLP